MLIILPEQVDDQLLHQAIAINHYNTFIIYHNKIYMYIMYE